MIKRADIPEGWTIEAADFINKCLQRKPANRLGLNGSDEVKQHIWLSDFDWTALLEQRLKAPFLPRDKPAIKPKKVNPEDEEKVEAERMEGLILLKRNSVQENFKDYFFDIDQLKF